jgi:hypothetical protein
MKQITATTLLAFASLVTAGSAFAGDRAVQATVPFNFTVGDKQLESGTYTITSPASGVINIQSKDGKISLMTTTSPDSNPAANRGKLVFDRYGDQYFLSEVLCPGAAISAALPTSKLERKVQMQQANLRSSGQIQVATK